MKKKLLLLFAFFSPVVLFSQPETPQSIAFSTSEFFEAQYSNGSHWTEDSMTFELGIFQNDIPTLSDILSGSGFDWTPIPLQESPDPTLPGDVLGTWKMAAESSTHGRFNGVTTVMSNDSPFSANTDIYILGYNGEKTSESSEWILLTNPDWKIPAVTSGIMPTFFSLYDPSSGSLAGTETVGGIGTIGMGPNGPFMTSAAIPEPSTYALFVGIGLLGFLGVRRFRRS